MSFIHHPVFQSLVLPFALAVVSCLLLRLAGPRSTSLGAALGLVIALAIWPGFDWPANSRVQWLPWVTLVVTALAATALLLHAPGTRALGRLRGRVSTVVLTFAALALAAWAALGGSLLLAQIAAMLGSVAGVLVLVSWLSASITPVSLLPLWVHAIGVALCMAALPAAAPEGTGAAPADDPYYAPSWK